MRHCLPKKIARIPAGKTSGSPGTHIYTSKKTRQETLCPSTHCIEASMCPLYARHFRMPHKHIMQRHLLTRSGACTQHVPAPPQKA